MIVWMVQDMRNKAYYRVVVGDSGRLIFQKFYDLDGGSWDTWDKIHIKDFCDMTYDRLVTNMEKK